MLNLLQSFTKYSREKTMSCLYRYNFFIIYPCKAPKIADLILLLNSQKVIGPDSIPTKIFPLLSHDISILLIRLFRNSFSHGLFSFILTLTKVVYTCKKYFKITCSHYHSISHFSIIEKILRHVNNFLF